MTRKELWEVDCLSWAVIGLACVSLAATGNGHVAEVSADELMMSTIAGTGHDANNGDAGWATDINVGQPFGVELAPDGALYVTEVQHHRIRRVDLQTHQITTVAGCGAKGYSGDGGPATQARLNEPYEVRFDAAGKQMYFVEMQNHLVRRVQLQSGIIDTVAGSGEAGFAGDGGPAQHAKFRQPHSIALHNDQSIYVADIGNHRVRCVDLTTGIITTVAGNGTQQLPLEGQDAAGTPVMGPRALTVQGNTLWIALREGHSVWRLDLQELVWHHVAGAGRKGYHDGNTRDALFNGPKGIARGPDGKLYVVDTENHVIRVVDPVAGVVETVVGSGQMGSAGDGMPARAAQMDRPHGICVGPDGTIYIGDTSNHRVRRAGRRISSSALRDDGDGRQSP